jgi:hypothetical protein
VSSPNSCMHGQGSHASRQRGKRQTTPAMARCKIGSAVHIIVAGGLPLGQTERVDRDSDAEADSEPTPGLSAGANAANPSADSTFSSNRPILQGAESSPTTPNSRVRQPPCSARPGLGLHMAGMDQGSRPRAGRLDQSSDALTPRICFEGRGSKRGVWSAAQVPSRPARTSCALGMRIAAGKRQGV